MWHQFHRVDSQLTAHSWLICIDHRNAAAAVKTQVFCKWNHTICCACSTLLILCHNLLLVVPLPWSALLVVYCWRTNTKSALSLHLITLSCKPIYVVILPNICMCTHKTRWSRKSVSTDWNNFRFVSQNDCFRFNSGGRVLEPFVDIGTFLTLSLSLFLSVCVCVCACIQRWMIISVQQSHGSHESSWQRCMTF